MKDWYYAIGVPAFVPREKTARLQNIQSITNPHLTSWNDFLNDYRKLSDEELEDLRDQPPRGNRQWNPNFSDAAAQVLLEREYAKIQEEERRLEFRKQKVVTQLHHINPGVGQAVSNNWSMYPDAMEEHETLA